MSLLDNLPDQIRDSGTERASDDVTEKNQGTPLTQANGKESAISLIWVAVYLLSCFV
jgi:hypothetical protein